MDALDSGTKNPTNHETCEHRVYKLVLTGGPCGGKTTAQEHLHKFFTDRGWKVFVVPETPTIFINGGVKFAELTAEQNYVFQVNLLRAQVHVESVFMHLAEALQRDCVVICDRGTNDIRAYIDDQSWNKMLQSYNVHAMQVRDSRYDQVLHLTTAADGAQSFYTLSTNTARTETAEQALMYDMKTRNAWLGHPRLDIVDNSMTKSFDDKMAKVLRVVADRMNLDVSNEPNMPPKYRTRKWQVDKMDVSKIPTPHETFELTLDHLTTGSDQIESVLIKRTQKDASVFASKIRRRRANNDLIETNRPLTVNEYTCLLALRDPSLPTQHKHRWSFFDNHGVYFHLEKASTGLITIKTFTNREEITLPDCVDQAKEIQA